MTAIVSDSSPLNYFALLDDFDLLRQLFGTLIIPPAVHREVVQNGSGYPVQAAVRAALGNWITLADSPDPLGVQTLALGERLDPGESEAIIIAETRA